MRSRSMGLLGVLLAALLTACEGPRNKGECETCSGLDECRAGLSCERDGAVSFCTSSANACGTATTPTAR